jgi:enamine deaminase RidA (YjgF/YER057c/UK114 family)
MERQLVSSGTEWERQVGYSRAVRIGDRVEVSGTTGTVDGEIRDPDGPGAQARQAFANVEAALDEAGADIDDVIRTRLYVADADDWEAVGAAHESYFGDVRPATTLLAVAGFVDDDMLVEVEAVAVVA